MTEPGEVTPTAYAAVGPENPTAAAPARWRQWAMLALKIGIAVALVAWLSVSGRLNLAAVFELKPSWPLAGLFVLTLFSLGLPVWRWWWLLRIQGIEVSGGKALRLSWYGYFCALFLPGAASGDAVKAFLIVRGRANDRVRAFSTVIVDRLLGLYSLTFFAIGPVALWWWQGALTESAAALGFTTLMLWLGATIALGLVAWPPTRRLSLRVLPTVWRDALEGSWQCYARDPLGMAGCFAISLVIDVVAVASFPAAAAAMNFPVDWNASFVAGPLAIIANGIPLTPGGAGVGEAASGEMFSALGVPGGTESMLLIRVVSLLVTLPAPLFRLRD